ncbi:MAG: hypothetical protein KO318_11215 [Methanobacterium sp.]|jgi:hypothetical protein|uniref:Uncharacterized protein n=1 Tax=Methanobacterium subterraneum TaxID=59277 RepID=A0A2H4VB27_9EURY|nr:hypothetical protein [Methanobacterium subterraneum]AUB55288.1 hypothetical protein BK007_04160 [Methanobacterium subterraneum]AUB57735.1 hypothetical protein BK008_05020 [Methanobacterium sp. MZ-A1]MCC7560976.1 hypothetical protein [Methanobacterium sp.]PKL72006.1 MAG: hypothetical protein CVV29_07800 [Methanobacteriales archaeon HGW-Methanobacteriales-2]
MEIEKTQKRDPRSIKYLLWKYQTKQLEKPIKIIPCATGGKLRRLDMLAVHGRTRLYMVLVGIRFYGSSGGPGVNHLCHRCRCETVILAIIFYVKFVVSKKRPLSDYRLARRGGLTEEIYGTVVTKLGS